MATRTRLDIDNDALEFATSYAESRGVSLCIAISELIRRAEQTLGSMIRASSNIKRDAQGFLVVNNGGPVITAKLVKKESEDNPV